MPTILDTIVAHKREEVAALIGESLMLAGSGGTLLQEFAHA